MEMFTSENRFISLANKYRPQKFADLVGQETISKTLTNAIKLGRIGHGYLFYGPRGCGKTTSARIFAKSLNCTGHGDKPTADPCGKCPSCIEIAQSSDIDVLELDAASNTQVEKIREAIIDTVSLASARDRYKIFILDEVHMLSDSSFNALLKTIEEPPAHVVFILATTEKHKVPATIVSRCQTFRFSPITSEDIASHLTNLAEKENIQIEPKAVKLLAKNAAGAMRDALTLFDRAIAYSDGLITENMVSEMLGLMPEELLKNGTQALLKKDSVLMHKTFESLSKEGYDPLSFLRDLKNTLGEMFYLSLGHGEEPFAGAKQMLEDVSAAFLASLTRKVTKVIDEVKFTDTPLINAEVGLFTVMDSCIDIDSFIRRLEALESGTELPAPKPVKMEKPMEVKVMKAAITSTVHVKPMPAPVAVMPVSAPAQTLSNNNEIWAKLKEQFSHNPFVTDALDNCSVSFSDKEYVLSFDENNSFYKTAVEMKTSDIETKLQTISGKKIKITFGAEAAPAAASAPAPAKTVEAKKENPLISEEKPFVNRDFSAEFEVPKKSTANMPKEVQDILKFIPGTMVE